MKECEKVTVTCSGQETFALRTNENRVSVNFSDKKTLIKESFPAAGNRVSIFYGKTSVGNEIIEAEYYIKAFSSSVDKEQGVVQSDMDMSGMDIYCIDGYITVVNKSANKINYIFTSNSIRREIQQEPGETIEIKTDAC